MKTAINILASAACLAASTSVSLAQSGSASGAESSGGEGIEHCDQTLGSMAIDEDTSAGWYHYYSSHYQLGSTIPLLRLIMQQSNCFVIVERGAAMNNMMRERDLAQSGELRSNAAMHKGQMVAADYTMSPSIQYSEKGTGGVSGAVRHIPGLGSLGGVVSSMAGSLKKNEAATTLLLIDNRSGVQLAAAAGAAKNYDFAGYGSSWGSAFAGISGYSNTPQGKVVSAAFVDSYNNMVRSLRNYRAQTVRGGLGAGGSLGVQGGQTDASKGIR